MIRKVSVFLNGAKEDVLFLRASYGHGALITTTFFQTERKLFDIGNTISIDVEIGGQNSRIFYGFIRSWNYQNQDGVYEYHATGVLGRAKDNFLASSTPDSAYKIRNKSIESLIGDLLYMSGITNYQYDPTNFYLAVTHDYEINLISAYDMIVQAKKIVAYEVWDNPLGVVQLRNRKPYLTGSDTSYKTISDIIDFTYSVFDTDLRNRVVVYGDNVYSERKQASPYLPSGFYKTVVLASNLIQSQTFADLAAEYNLNLLNKLTYELSVTKELFDYVEPYKAIKMSIGNPLIDGDWYVYNSDVEIRKNSGALQILSLRR